tara:strand:+ start:331 stop:813 length:483 start_codon:yes stop_codon:yes gene_type:complete
MKEAKILFLHGMEGTPEGTKPTFLRGKGFRVIAPSLPKEDFTLSVKRAEYAMHAFKPDVIVGSSRGGAVACAMAAGYTPKILIAPAYKKFDVKNPDVDITTTILHCKKDDLVDFEDSIKLKEQFACDLIECGEGHRMSDPAALQTILDVLKEMGHEPTMG